MQIGDQLSSEEGCQQVVVYIMLKTIGKFEDPFIVNLNLFITIMFNDSKRHENMFIVLNDAMVLIECNPNETT